MSSPTVPINKGHFDIDTEERKKQFSQKLAKGWEKEYAEYRRMWEELPKQQIVRDWPLLVDLELSSLCNLNCPMCPTITESFKKTRRKGLMDFSLVEKIVDEVAGHVFSLRLSWVGEPTLHPRFVDAIRYAKEKGIKEVSCLTNGSKLDLPHFIPMAEAGLDWLTVSVDGMGEEYNKIRKPLNFNDTFNHLRAIQKYKDDNKREKPVIKIQGVWPAIRVNPTQYYETLKPYTDLIAYNPLIDYLRKDHEIVYVDNFICPQPYQRVTVGSDGRVMMCSNDEYGEEILGNAYEQTIYEIWHGEKMNHIRETHKTKDGFLKIPTCQHCYYPRKAVPDERAVVGNREIWVENYVNRKQAIGE